MKHLWVWALLLLTALGAVAGELAMRGTCDAENMCYQPGQKAEFTLNLCDDGEPVPVELVKYEFLGDGGLREAGELVVNSAEPIRLSAGLSAPGVLRLTATACKADGTALSKTVSYWGQEHEEVIRFDGGAIFGFGEIRQDGEDPADFDAFWRKQVERLAAVPVEVLEMRELVDESDEEVILYDVRVACAGGKPVSGILSMPRNAKDGSLRAVAVFQGYGVTQAWGSRDEGLDKIFFVVNAHGFDNRREQGYYDALAAGELAGYGLSAAANQTPEASYFCAMALRAARATEFLKTLPQWDGKNLETTGHSQGGFQAIAAAVLADGVTGCYANMPWLANMEGMVKGRLHGWYPEWIETFRYFDPVNFAKRLKCPLKLNTGLGDYVCTPYSVICIYNAAAVPAEISIWQNVNHTDMHNNSTQHAVFKRNGMK